MGDSGSSNANNGDIILGDLTPDGAAQSPSLSDFTEIEPVNNNIPV